MNLSRDLTSSKAMHAKGALFVVLGGLSATLLPAMIPTWRAAALLACCVWAFCRFYGDLFYVLERYLGRERRFAGVRDALRFLLFRPKETRGPNGGDPLPRR